MTNETLKMQMLAGVITESEYKAKLQENKVATKKKPLKEHFIGMGAINSPFIERKKETYEDAFEHFLGGKYDLKENEETEDAFSSPSDTNPVVQDYLKQLTDMLNNQTDDTFDLKNLKYAVDKFSNMINDEIAKFEVEEGKEIEEPRNY
jgi:small-conductance mechanosensitive channel